jgi:hypothetical protein
MPLEAYALAVAIIALVVALVALYYATHTKRLYQEVPPPHQHKWKLLHSTDKMHGWKNHVIGYIHTLQCEGCGDIKAKDVKLSGNN